MKDFEIIDKIEREKGASLSEYAYLVENMNEEAIGYAREKAIAVRKKIYGNGVFVRGLIEISNICKNDCFYCGIRRSNSECQRYRLTTDEIIACCDEGERLGVKTFVLQGGEDGYFSDEILCDIIKKIKDYSLHAYWLTYLPYLYSI